MKKKMLAVVMAAAMMASLGSLAFADDVSDTTPKDTTVNYTVASKYTVSIPASISCSDGVTLTGLSITATDNVIEAGKALKVKVSGLGTDSDAGTIALTNNSDTVKIPVKLGDAACANDTVVASFAAGGTTNSVNDALKLDSTGITFTYAGTYSGTLTFTLGIE